MKTAVLAATSRGRRTAERIQRKLPGAELIVSDHGVRQALESAWADYDAIICVMAAGIVVRCIGGLCVSKLEDPCVLVADEEGRHVISLLSGHIGGGNELARDVAVICAGTPVITTASDVAGVTSVDLWAVEHNLAVATPELLPSTAAKLIDTGVLRVFQEKPYIETLPTEFEHCPDRAEADIVIALDARAGPDHLHLIPRIYVIGIGCRRGTPVEAFEEMLVELERRHRLAPESVGGLASIDLKRDEPGLLEFSRARGWPIRFFTAEQLGGVEVSSPSQRVHDKVGVYGVCESAALLAATKRRRPARLVVAKIKWEKITAAVAVTAY